MSDSSVVAAPVVYCHYAATAPRDCDQVAARVLCDAQGQIVGRWVCTFCAEQQVRGEKRPKGEKRGKR